MLKLNPITGAVLGAFGDAVELGLAIDPKTGLIYVGTAAGVATFNPATSVFSQYSKDLNLRVASLAFAADGTLWGTTWPDRTQVVLFDAHRRAQVQLTFDTPIDSLAFGQKGTALAGLLFVSHNSGDGGSVLTMVDSVTLQQVSLATGGTRGDVVLTTNDGRLLISQSAHVDVLNPITNPVVLATNPPDQSIVALPLSLITVTFDQDMVAGSPADAASTTNPANYTLTGADGHAATLVSVAYDSATHTALLTVKDLTAEKYTLTIRSSIMGVSGFSLAAPFAVSFNAVIDVANYASIHIVDTQLDRATQTVTYQVTITNTTNFDLLLPLLLTLDPAKYVQGAPQGAAEATPDGRWVLDLANNIPGGVKLAPGQTTSGFTVHIVTPGFETADYEPGVIGVPDTNSSPSFTTQPVAAATAGQPYTYAAVATDPGASVVAYLLQQAPPGMAVDASTGVITWAPTAQSPGVAPVTLYAFDARGAWTKQHWTVTVAGGNDPPVFGPLPVNLQITEGQAWQVPVTATDANGDPLIYWVDSLPPGATFTPDTHVFSWTPPIGSSGTYPGVTVYVSDGTSTVSQSFDVLVAPANHPPALSLPPDRAVRQGDGFVLYLAGSDPDGGKVLYSSTNLPEGAVLDANTGRFQWVVPYDLTGPVAVPIAVTSTTGLTLTKTITFTVLSTQVAPVFDPQTGWTVDEGQSLTFQTFAIDPHNPGFKLPTRNPDGTLNPPTPVSPVTYAISGLPAGATFDAQTATFSWVPSFIQAGQYTVTVTATDVADDNPPLSARVTIPITVRNINRAPQIATISNVSLNRGQVLTLPATAIDPDGDPVVLSATNALTNMPFPSFATFVDNGNGNGVFHFAPLTGDRGNYSIVLRAADNGDGAGEAGVLSSTYTFIVTVVSANEPPVLAPINSQVALTGTAFTYTVHSSDTYQDPLTFSFTGLPAEATLTPAVTYGTALLSWTPTAAEAGNYTVTVTVTDNAITPPVLDSKTFNLTVRTSDNAPVATTPGGPTLAEGATLTLPLHATDADGDPVTWSATNLPIGAVLDAATGKLTWSPAFGQTGTYPITVSASDGVLSSSGTFSIVVTHTDRVPILVPEPPQYGRENTLLTFTIAGADPDGDPAQLAVQHLPAGALFNNLNGVFVWTPDFAEAGDYTVSFTLTDPAGHADAIQVPIHIDNVDRAPVLAIANHQAILGQTLTFSAAGTDPDVGDVQHFAAQGLPEGATLDANTGLVTWTPGPAQAGDYVVRFSVSDGTLTTSQAIFIHASVTPTPPVATIVLTPSFPVAQAPRLLCTPSAPASLPLPVSL